MYTQKKIRLPGFTGEQVLYRMAGRYEAAGAEAGSADGGKVVPQLFYIPVGPHRCAVGEYAGGACWFYGVVSC